MVTLCDPAAATSSPRFACSRALHVFKIQLVGIGGLPQGGSVWL